MRTNSIVNKVKETVNTRKVKPVIGFAIDATEIYADTLIGLGVVASVVAAPVAAPLTIAYGAFEMIGMAALAETAKKITGTNKKGA